MAELAVQTVNINGVDIAYLEQGEGPLVLCLHGFPDSAYSFEGLLETLAAAGYRAVAPFLRGYYPSGLAPDGDYSIPAVAADILGLVDELGGGKASIIGHDWGGFTAYTAANMAPEKIERITVMAVPHMHVTAMSWAQLKKSWYVMFFQLPWLPEKIVSRDNFAFIDRLYHDWCPNWEPEHFKLSPVKRALGIAGGLKAALGYYRAMIRGSNASDRAIMERQTSVPALWIVGTADGSVGVEQFAGIEAAFTDTFEILMVDGAGHFVHREARQQVENKILEFFRA